jgi:hypothetical protein
LHATLQLALWQADMDAKGKGDGRIVGSDRGDDRRARLPHAHLRLEDEER